MAERYNNFRLPIHILYDTRSLRLTFLLRLEHQISTIKDLSSKYKTYVLLPLELIRKGKFGTLRMLTFKNQNL
jgi:hypothetical protein